MVAGVVILAAAMAVLAIVGSRGGAGSDRPALPPDQAVNRIAVVGLDGQIRTMKPDGAVSRQISGGRGFFTWPTWSPDGRGLVYSGLVPDAAGAPTITLLHYRNSTGESREIHTGEPGFAGLLADGVVHYPIWSPDSRKLAFIIVTREHGLTLLLDDLSDDAHAAFVLDNGPLWLSWSIDSARLLVHRADGHFLVDADGPLKVTDLGVKSVGYRVPAWRPDGQSVAFARNVGASTSILYSAPLTSDGLGAPVPIAVLAGDSAFLWSAKGGKLAVADESRAVFYQGAPASVYRRLRVLGGSDHGELARIEDHTLAYFWSPDGAKIAFVTAPDGRGSLRWNVYDIETGDWTMLVDFIPSADQMTMFRFFDQYAYSHTPWSPDSRYLVFAGTLSDQAATVSYGSHPGHPGAHVYVLDTGESMSAEAIADGVLASWSPR